MTGAPPAEIVYLPRWRPRGSRPGAHRGRDPGGLGTFRDQVPFLALPDARRIDLRATLRDPFEGVHVRRFEARAPVEVWALVDLSASMGFRGTADRIDLARDLCAGLAASATRIGDGFGLIGCDRAIRADLYLPATRRRAAALAAAARLADAPRAARSAEGMLDAARRLAGRPKLVFLVSDFRWPEPLVARVFAALALHDTVPVLLADSAEDAGLPDWGLAELDDLEGGGRRVVFLRPALRRRWIAREHARRDALRRAAGAAGARAPFHLVDRFDADALSRHLLAT
ncbi:DUF58 domain-containing protein [Methylobacterium sp. NEAU 140]|uniref:DUF58 domain-containing protein n=1 Tax=Methylobacterium sp. NEAU 140 TaxID=3064945 RepID=UPI00273573A6|nr:DUF58 domain-containing protein [Methylobacterium sp. NEAU 140]MDP4021373.1 DUF58 domain-containing protein [Methylobacterium sp. NEAU 140]